MAFRKILIAFARYARCRNNENYDKWRNLWCCSVCTWFSVLVVEGKGLKFPLNLFIANPSPNVSPVLSLFLFTFAPEKRERKKLALLNPVTIHETYTTVEWKDFGFHFYGVERKEGCRRCTRIQIHLLCKHLMHHCYVSCCLRMLSSCYIVWAMNRRRQGVIMHSPSLPLSLWLRFILINDTITHNFHFLHFSPLLREKVFKFVRFLFH